MSRAAPLSHGTSDRQGFTVNLLLPIVDRPRPDLLNRDDTREMLRWKEELDRTHTVRYANRRLIACTKKKVFIIEHVGKERRRVRN